MFIKQPYILCCVFPSARFIGWLIEFTMCPEKHKTRHDNPCTHRAYRFLTKTRHICVGPPSHLTYMYNKMKRMLHIECMIFVGTAVACHTAVLPKNLPWNLWYGFLQASSRRYSWQVSCWWSVTCMTLWLFRYKDIFSKATNTPYISISLSWRVCGDTWGKCCNTQWHHWSVDCGFFHLKSSSVSNMQSVYHSKSLNHVNLCTNVPI